MTHPSRPFVCPVLALLAGLTGLNPAARADINGFGTLLPALWTVNSPDPAAPPTYNLPTQTLQLTNTLSNAERRSVWYTVPQSVTQFTASFTYRAANASGVFGGGCGAAFVLQNSADGTHAVGTGAFAYGGIGNSGAVTLELYTSSSASGFFLNGNVGSNGLPTGSVSLISGHPINVMISFDGTFLSESMTDTVTGQTYNPAPFLASNLLASLGGSTALVGFTANTTGNETADQYFSNVLFTVPSPAGLSLLGVAGLGSACRRRRRAGGIGVRVK